ncbi:hypothetical protein KI387_001350, partial [Taxus chinensis]
GVTSFGFGALVILEESERFLLNACGLSELLECLDWKNLVVEVLEQTLPWR